MIYLYTENFSLLPRIKNRLKKMLGMGPRGPQAVLDSLERGLAELGVAYKLNQPLPEAPVPVRVLSGTQTLKWAINKKRKGRVNKIVAGPNLVVSPLDENKILCHSAIDIILVPSEWVKEFYIQLAPELSAKLRVWPAGVEAPSLVASPKPYDFLILNKLRGDMGLYNSIVSLLQSRNSKFNILQYGKFGREQYFEALKTAKFIIYLSESESQGLAMFEAWARNVPSLVWERGFFSRDGKTISGYTASPYLLAEAGLRFKDFDDFKILLPALASAKFSPRKYVLENFTDKICAQKYLEIINA